MTGVGRYNGSKVMNYRLDKNTPYSHMGGRVINMTYGDNSAAEWLIYQLTFLGLYAGVKEKFTEDNILQLALVIQHEYYYLNIAEMMLFFVRFMAVI